MPPFDLAPYRPVAVDDLVRLGRDNDGGYVVSRRTVDAARVLVGLGINDDWSFEEAFARARPDVEIVGVDGSVSPEVFRANARRQYARAAREAALAIGGAARARRSLLRAHLAAARGGVREARAWLRPAREMPRFFDGRRHHFVQRYFEAEDGPTSVTWATLGRRFGFLGGDPPARPDVFLKMDIEGAEYRTLAGVLPDAAARIAGAVVEFHDLDREWDRFAAAMDALQGPFVVAHVHANNCRPVVPGTTTPEVLEVTFVNRALADRPPRPSPHAYPVAGLDMPNTRAVPDHPLVF